MRMSGVALDGFDGRESKKGNNYEGLLMDEGRGMNFYTIRNAHCRRVVDVEKNLRLRQYLVIYWFTNLLVSYIPIVL